MSYPEISKVSEISRLEFRMGAGEALRLPCLCYPCFRFASKAVISAIVARMVRALS